MGKDDRNPSKSGKLTQRYLSNKNYFNRHEEHLSSVNQSSKLREKFVNNQGVKTAWIDNAATYNYQSRGRRSNSNNNNLFNDDKGDYRVTEVIGTGDTSGLLPTESVEVFTQDLEAFEDALNQCHSVKVPNCNLNKSPDGLLGGHERLKSVLADKKSANDVKWLHHQSPVEQVETGRGKKNEKGRGEEKIFNNTRKAPKYNHGSRNSNLQTSWIGEELEGESFLGSPVSSYGQYRNPQKFTFTAGEIYQKAFYGSYPNTMNGRSFSPLMIPHQPPAHWKITQPGSPTVGYFNALVSPTYYTGSFHPFYTTYPQDQNHQQFYRYPSRSPAAQSYNYPAVDCWSEQRPVDSYPKGASTTFGQSQVQVTSTDKAARKLKHICGEIIFHDSGNSDSSQMSQVCNGTQNKLLQSQSLSPVELVTCPESSANAACQVYLGSPHLDGVGSEAGDVTERLGKLGIDQSPGRIEAKDEEWEQIVLVRICSECRHVNEENVNWCIECGSVLLSESPVSVMEAEVKLDATNTHWASKKNVDFAKNGKEDFMELVDFDIEYIDSGSEKGANRFLESQVSFSEHMDLFACSHDDQMSSAFFDERPHCRGERFESKQYDSESLVYKEVECYDGSSSQDDGSRSVFQMDEEIAAANMTVGDLPIVPAQNLSEMQTIERADQSTGFHQVAERKKVIRNYGSSKTKGPKRMNQRPVSAAAGQFNQSVCNRLVAQTYHRHWEKSSIAWSSFHPRELRTRSSIDFQKVQDDLPASKNSQADQRPGYFKVSYQGGRKTSHSGRKPCSVTANSNNENNRRQTRRGSGAPQQRPWSSQSNSHVLPSACKKQTNGSTASKSNPTAVTSQGMGSARLSYIKYLEMTPKIQDGSISQWQCLPDEILLYIFSFLDLVNKLHSGQVCTQFHRVAMDESLWKRIVLKKKSLCDDWLLKIANKRPTNLAFIQCHGEMVTAEGLNKLFQRCSESLCELNFSRCSKGDLTGDKILTASSLCHNLTSVDSSWCTVTDSGLAAISNGVERLENLYLNGCGMITDEGLKTVILKHCKSLRVLEMFGCFNTTSKGIRCLASQCTKLHTLKLGQCNKLSDLCIAELSSSLSSVENLDLRGCSQIRDNCIEKVVHNCPQLCTIALANCPYITNTSMNMIANQLPKIRSIDVCGCRLITDESIDHLAKSCRCLQYLDISSTGCTCRSVCRLAEAGPVDLETLKLNFLTDITENSLMHLAKNCKMLTTLHLYGCKRVRNIDKIRTLHPQLVIEADKD